MQTPQVPALPYMSPLGFQLLNVACRDCQRTTEDDSADHETWIDGLCLYCQHAAAMSSPDFSSESAPPMTPERAAEVRTLYARAEAAAATIRAVTRWRAALAGMTSADPDEALDAVWEAGEVYDNLLAEDDDTPGEYRDGSQEVGYTT